MRQTCNKEYLLTYLLTYIHNLQCFYQHDPRDNKKVNYRKLIVRQQAFASQDFCPRPGRGNRQCKIFLLQQFRKCVLRQSTVTGDSSGQTVPENCLLYFCSGIFVFHVRISCGR